MPEEPTSDPKQFIKGAPVLHVPDVVATATWYRGERYAVVWRDDAAVHLVHGDRPPTGVHLSLWVRDVDAYHREVVGRGAVVTIQPSDRPYGLRASPHT